MLKTEAIAKFLADKTEPDLAALYHKGMEVQVNVAQEGGTQITQESGYSGRVWRGFTDGETTWKPFRIPWHARTTPEYKDGNMSFDLGKYTEGVGMTGWDWQAKRSRWVAYDFDSIVGHAGAKVLTQEELDDIKLKVNGIPWVTVRSSTGGNGLHIYVFVDVPTDNHTEHAALARAILGRLSAEAGLDLQAQVDTCGGNMWVWHRKKIESGLKIIKEGVPLTDVPANWRDHLTVITGKRRKNLPDYIETDDLDIFEQLCAQRPKIKLDPVHRKLIDWLKKNNAQWWWDQDHWMMVCHTNSLAQAHKELGFRGTFTTRATGKDDGDHNCFCYPQTKPVGSWTVRRYGQGTEETDTWNQDGKGWTFCSYNEDLTLEQASMVSGAIEDEKGLFHFANSDESNKALQFMGIDTDINVPRDRPVAFKRHKDGRLIIQTDAISDEQLSGWKKTKDTWSRVINATIEKKEKSNPEVQEYSAMVRHLLTNNIDAGWSYKVEAGWVEEGLRNVQLALGSLGLSNPEVNKIIGDAINLPWLLVNEPFQPEYIGDRRWNRDGAQFAYTPQLEAPFVHKTWDMILDHVGSGLTTSVFENEWCKENGILTGGDYLRTWAASLFQCPKKKLPYLFFYSEAQRTGKSTFHEMLGKLMTKGYEDCSTALTSQANFNKELLNAILCRIEETDLQRNSLAKNRIKNWVTAREISCHEKGKTPYLVTNYTHYVQCGNSISECPVFDGDTRVVIAEVPEITKTMNIDELEERCLKEAPAFLATLLSLELPVSSDPRLNLPIIDTAIKQQAQQSNRSTIDMFFSEIVKEVPGSMILYSDLWNKFQNWVDPSEVHNYTKIKFGKKLPTRFPKGRVISKGSQFYIGNLAWASDDAKPSKRLKLDGDKLI